MRSQSLPLAFCLLTLIQSSHSWDLQQLGIEDSFKLLHVTLYYVRVFICIKSSDDLNPTLVETTWPENLLAIRPKIFPSDRAHAKNKTDCSKIVQARWTDIDDTSRLWLLDAGNDYCNPKIIIYDLVRRNIELFRAEDFTFKGDDVTSMKLDPDPPNGEDRAYFTLSHGRFLMVYHLRSRKWIKLIVQAGAPWEAKRVHVHEIAFTLDHRIYIANKKGHLFIADTFTRKDKELKATYLGSLLDEPKGLITDPIGVLYYILPKHGAIVRWEPTRTLNAEGHEVLLFQTLPVIQIFFGIQGSVWIATEHMQTLRDHCVRVLFYFGVASNFADLQ